MKAAVGFIFFMLFLAGLAFVNLRNVSTTAGIEVTTAEAITGVRWRPTHIGEMPLPDDHALFLEFAPDGSLSGNAGCNRFSADYAIAESRITVTPLVSTRMACPGEAGAFEYAFLDALQSMNSAVRSESRLAIRNASGAIVSRFVAQHDIDDAR